MVKDGLRDSEIDFWNFYKQNEARENESLADFKPYSHQYEYEEYIKKKKNNRNKRYPKSILLHSACQGCMSNYW